MVGKELIRASLFGSGGGSSGSGGAAGVSPKDVNFYDYDGTCVHAYTVEEAQALSELPAGPEHPGLVFQGWNWSLEGVKGLTRAMNIGAMYTTDDGTTRLYITLQEGRTSPMLGVGVNGTVTVDWGDGTEPDVLTGTNVKATYCTPNHTYAAPGDYVIRLTVDGEMGILGSLSTNAGSYIMRFSKNAEVRNQTYLNALKRVELGDNVTALNAYAFYNCCFLEMLSMSDSVTSIGSEIFRYCYNLRSVAFPNSVSGAVSSSTFEGCHKLRSVAFPNSMSGAVGGSVFFTCYSIESVALPDGVTNLSYTTFANCYSLSSVSMPHTLTSIGSSTFNKCLSLMSVVVPAAVMSLGSSEFSGCCSMLYYDFTSHTAVPTLSSTSAFTGIPADCEIRVPAALYDEWIAATNWATYASQIKAY